MEDDLPRARFRLEPGWRWSKDVKPIAGTPSCIHRHVGYVIAGHLHVVLDDGTELDVRAGDGYEIPPGHDAWIVGDAPYDSIECTSGRAFACVPEDADQGVLATVVFTDIVDSTATLARVGDSAWRRVLLTHNDRLRDEIERFRGREIATTGDGFLALFDGAARAVRCAASMSSAVRDLGIGSPLALAEQGTADGEKARADPGKRVDDRGSAEPGLCPLAHLRVGWPLDYAARAPYANSFSKLVLDLCSQALGLWLAAWRANETGHGGRWWTPVGDPPQAAAVDSSPSAGQLARPNHWPRKVIGPPQPRNSA